MDNTFVNRNTEGDHGIASAITAGQKLEQAGSAAATAIRKTTDAAGAVPFRLDNGYGKLVSAERWEPAPTAIRQSTTLLTARGFAQYVNLFKATSTIVFFNRDTKFVAVLDYHEPSKPSWSTHRATFEAKRTREWLLWKSFDNKPMTQVDFAQFLEDNLPDIAAPDAATIVEAARNMEATKEVTFKSQVNVGNGSVKFTYDEFVNNGTRPDTVDLLNGMTLSLPILEGLDNQAVQVRIRYQIGAGGKLSMRYMLVRAQDAEDEAMELIAGTLGEQIQGVQFIDGNEPGAPGLGARATE